MRILSQSDAPQTHTSPTFTWIETKQFQVIFETAFGDFTSVKLVIRIQTHRLHTNELMITDVNAIVQLQNRFIFEHMINSCIQKIYTTEACTGQSKLNICLLKKKLKIWLKNNNGGQM